MTTEMWITIAILVLAVIFFVTEKLRADIVALCVLIGLILSGVLTTEEAIAGFSSTSVLSIAFLFVVGGAVFHTGLTVTISNYILKVAGTSELRLIFVLMVAIAAMSSVISSTGVVALMLPAVMNLANRSKVPASKLLMPMAFSALFSAATTLIATPPNIIASEALEKAGYAPFNFFSFTIPGVILAVLSIIYMLLIGRRFLPNRQNDPSVQRMETPLELFELYKLPDNMFRMRVHNLSNLIDETISGSRLRSDFKLNVINITRTNETGEEVLHQLQPDAVILEDDILLVQGHLDDVVYAAGYWNLTIMANTPIKQGDVITNEVGIAEIILRPRSSFTGKTLTELRFGSTFNLTVLNMRRPGSDETLDIKDTPLKFGDMLLVQGRWKDIFALKRLRHDFIVMGEPEAAELGAFTRTSHATTTLLIMLGMVVVLALNITSLTVASMIAAALIVLTGSLTMDEAYHAIDWKSIVVIAGILPMSTALSKVGLVDIGSEILMTTLGEAGPLFMLGGIFAVTVLCTQLISNTATALLIAPVAITAATGLGVAPEAFMMAVAIGASMAFISPVSTPVTMLVMGAGNYRFSDFGKVGAPIILIAFVVVMTMLPVLFPF